MNVKNKHLNQIKSRIATVISFAFAIILFFPFSILGNSISKTYNSQPLVQKSNNIYKNQQQKPVKEEIYTCFDIEKEPEFKGGEKAMLKFMKMNMHYPLIAQRAGVEGTVIVRFVVDKTGKISNVKIKQGIGSGCDEEAIRVIKVMPAWNPGRNNGRFVPVIIQLPILFQLSKKIHDENANIVVDYKSINSENEKNRPLINVEHDPEFKGGYNAMLKFLKKNMKYPITPRKAGTQGIVFVYFVVEKTGKITRVKLLRGIDKACDEEAIRLVKSMPDWIPGRQNGKVVASFYQIPVKFQLNRK